MARNSSRAFRKVAFDVVLRDGEVCGICGHGGAITADHIVSFRDWPKDHNGDPLPGLDHPDNLQAAHGSRGVGDPNPCHQCDPARWPRGRNCNQSKGAGSKPHTPEIHSQDW